MKTPTRKRVGNRQLLIKQAAKYARQAMDDLFEGIERFAEQENLEIDWPTLRVEVAPQDDPTVRPEDRMLEMRIQVDGVEKTDLLKDVKWRKK